MNPETPEEKNAHRRLEGRREREYEKFWPFPKNVLIRSEQMENENQYQGNPISLLEFAWKTVHEC